MENELKSSEGVVLNNEALTVLLQNQLVILDALQPTLSSHVTNMAYHGVRLQIKRTQQLLKELEND